VRKTLRDIGLMLGAKVSGDPEVVIEGLAGLDDAEPGTLTFLADSRQEKQVESTRASAILVSESFDLEPTIPYLKVKDASAAMILLAERIVQELPRPRPGKHPTAFTGRGVVLGKNTSIGPYAVIEDGTRVGDDAIIHAHCTIGREAVIGAGTILHPRVVVGERCVLGDRVILHPGVVVGADGFGFIQVEGRHKKIPQLGTVEIGDDVEIGANSTVDRARFGKTIVGRGTKTDDHVHIAHNVKIGENCILVAQVGIAGSSVIGDGAIIAGQGGVSDHVNVGKGARLLAVAVALQDVPEGATYSGVPAHDHAENMREWAAIRRLPEILKRLREIEKRLEGK
jgi:UDP-3-O-[3-hydroxymyristoyl] glucosamine N-acyltransferase